MGEAKRRGPLQVRVEQSQARAEADRICGERYEACRARLREAARREALANGATHPLETRRARPVVMTGATKMSGRAALAAALTLGMVGMLAPIAPRKNRGD